MRSGETVTVRGELETSVRGEPVTPVRGELVEPCAFNPPSTGSERTMGGAFDRPRANDGGGAAR